MSDWSKPTTTSNYSTAFIQELDARLKDLAYGLDPSYVTSYTGVPTNSIRWNWSATNPTLDVYNGTIWTASTKTFNLTAISATTLTTARNIVLSTDLSASVSFNGSSNVTLAATLTSVNATTTTVGSATTIPVLAFDTKGRVTSVSTVTVSSTIGSSGAINGADITLKIGTGDTTLARLQTNAAGTLLYLGNGTTVGAISPDATAATLQNKTINLSNNTLSGTLAQLSTMMSDDDIVGLSSTQSVTNKTLSTGCSWNGNTIGATYGGTGQTGYAIGDLLYASSTTALSKLAGVATGNVLRSGGVGVAPSWGKVNVTTDITGVVPQANGGFITTGLTGILYANNGAAATIATAAQLVAGISTSAVANATNATYATSAGTATSTDTATYLSGTMQTNTIYGKPQHTGMGFGSEQSANPGSFICKAPGAVGSNAIAGMTFWQDSYATQMGVRSDGYFLCGGWSRPSWVFYSDTSSNFVASGNITAYSDPRLKENFERVKNPLAILNSLDGGTFNWKKGISLTACKEGKRDYGILADQVEKVMPEIITDSIEDDDGIKYKTVCYEKLVPVLIEAIKELHSRIETLEAK